MFDIGWSELLVIAVIAIVVVGPKDLPKLMRTFGHYAGKLRRAASDFQRQFEEAIHESEVEEMRKAIESVRPDTLSLDLQGPIDQPMIPPQPEAAPPAEAPTAAKPARKRGPAKPKAPGAKRGKTRAERGP